MQDCIRDVTSASSRGAKVIEEDPAQPENSVFKGCIAIDPNWGARFSRYVNVSWLGFLQQAQKKLQSQ